MKKVVVLLASVALFAGSAFAATTISGTAHDLSAAGTGTNTEICVFCHTPHGASTAVSDAPLWNRTPINAAGSVYNGLKLEASTQTDMTITAINATDAPLCLSCHELATSPNAALLNPPNNGGARNLAGYVWSSTDAQLSSDMSNDHPIGFRYTNAQATDGELETKANAELALGALALSYGSDLDRMWCSSCHDVHNNTNSPFLRVSNAGSGLCLTCHLK